ncbi:MAG: 2-amino-4-hydroxy-6-hydroxymethyldihydropteridine diphosphokinase [Planctomycetes bacterium]|nr:2-amino-4-hydroxy-6-hydroxymethyldihydropteridine diphosphokinase [Planctomycetota bacterium]
MTATTACIALGSNLDLPEGDSAWILAEAVRRLNSASGVRVVTASSIYRTAPVGGPAGQREYLNAVAVIETTHAPRALLDLLLAIEEGLGRVRDPAIRNGPRTLDLDLVLFADQIIDEPGLHVPHQRFEERPFVLRPLLEVLPHAVNPRTGRALASALRSCSPLAVSVCGNLGVPP